MSQYGRHPIITKQEARALLPAKACRRCVYWTRVFGEPGYNWPCPECGSGEGLAPKPRPYWDQIQEGDKP